MHVNALNENTSQYFCQISSGFEVDYFFLQFPPISKFWARLWVRDAKQWSSGTLLYMFWVDGVQDSNQKWIEAFSYIYSDILFGEIKTFNWYFLFAMSLLSSALLRFSDWPWFYFLPQTFADQSIQFHKRPNFSKLELLLEPWHVCVFMCVCVCATFSLKNPNQNLKILYLFNLALDPGYLEPVSRNKNPFVWIEEAGIALWRCLCRAGECKV